MSLTLIIKYAQVIGDSSLPEKDKNQLISTIRTAKDWTPEQKAMYQQAIMEWDQNHVKGPRLDGKPFLTPFTANEN